MNGSGNYVKKSLSSLAGDDDSFFVIIDDRKDVWQVDKTVKNPQGQDVTIKVPSANLLPI